MDAPVPTYQCSALDVRMLAKRLMSIDRTLTDNRYVPYGELRSRGFNTGVGIQVREGVKD